MFWKVLYHLGAFGTVWLPYETRCQTGRTSAKLRATKSHWNFSLHWTLNSCFRDFCTIWVLLGPFGCHTKLGAKRAELVQNFVPRSRIAIFRNKRTRSTPLTLNSCFAEFCTIWLHLEPFGCLTELGATQAELVQKFVRCSRIGILF